MLEERHLSQNKKYQELIVFVHQYGGSKLTLRRHIEFVNEIGFDAISFNLSIRRITELRKFPLSSNYKIGLRHLWQKDIEGILDKYDEKKIVYSLSLPSMSALMAIVSRNARDISAWICDGGPVLKLERNIWNYFTYTDPIKNRALRALITLCNAFLWGHNEYKKDTIGALSQLPKNFPILSIRSWKDRLVSASSIDETFKDAEHLALEVLSLPESNHITGLKDEPDLYKSHVTQFLKNISHPD